MSDNAPKMPEEKGEASQIPSPEVIESKLAAREKKLAEAEVKLAQREEIVKQEEAAVEKQKQEDSKQRAGIDSDRKRATVEKEELAKERGKVAEERRVLEQLKTDAASGFARENEKALAALVAQRDETLKRLESATKELSRLSTEEREKLRLALGAEEDRLRKALSDRLTAEEQSRRATLDRDLEALRHAAEKSIAEERRVLNAKMTEVSRREGVLRAEEDRCQRWEAELETREAALPAEVNRRVEIEAKGLEARAKRLEQERASLLEETNDLRAQVDNYRELEKRFGGEYPARLKQLLDESRARELSLQDQLKLAPSPDLPGRFAELERQFEDLTAKESARSAELVRLQAYEAIHHAHLNERAGWAADREVLRRSREVLETQLERIEKQVKDEADRLKARRGEESLEKRAVTLRSPLFTHVNGGLSKLPTTPGVRETEWLNRVQKGIADCGVEIPRRLLNAFHTSLKTSEITQMTILAGVSGTGKSLLPKLYAKAGGILFHMASVQPDWDSPHALFGHYSSIEGQFNATELVRGLYQSQQKWVDGYEGTDHLLTMFLLDEMNLAHVELYFSDVLSKLEDRRGEKKVPDIGIDLGAGCDRFAIPLGRNILWVGTMNEDETTKALSDKVVDRSALITFPRPTELKQATLDQMAALKPANLLAADWTGWCKGSSITDKQLTPYKKGLEDLNKALAHSGRAIGHRIWQAVKEYMLLHPEVSAALDPKEIEAALKVAFEDQLAMRVMPKLRGLETSGTARKKTLDPIKKVLETDAPGLIADFTAASESASGVFHWHSAEYIAKTGDGK